MQDLRAVEDNYVVIIAFEFNVELRTRKPASCHSTLQDNHVAEDIFKIPSIMVVFKRIIFINDTRSEGSPWKLPFILYSEVAMLIMPF